VTTAEQLPTGSFDNFQSLPGSNLKAELQPNGASSSNDQLLSSSSDDEQDRGHSKDDIKTPNKRRWFQRTHRKQRLSSISDARRSSSSDSMRSISDRSSVEAKDGSHRFRKLARELATGLDINSSKEARKVARRIFEALSPNTSALLKAHAQHTHIDEHLVEMAKYGFASELSMQNFAPAFATINDAEKAFGLFDKDGNGSITPQEMKETVVAVFKDRKSLSASLRDVGSAVGKLDGVLHAATLVIALLLCLIIFGVAVGPFLVTSMSMIIAVTYVITSSLNVHCYLLSLILTCV
jgi:hypothetical protein